MGPPVRHPSRRTPPIRSDSKSPSPDPELMRYINEQKRPDSPESEAFRNKRIAAGGALNIKSRHQKEKEEAEKKKLDEEERAAKAYQDFVRDMEGNARDGHDSKGGFVRAGSSSSYEPATRRHPHSSYPTFQPSDEKKRSETVTASTSMSKIDVDDQLEDDMKETSRKREVLGKRIGAMGSFLGELQRDQAEREERLRSKVAAQGTSISTLLARETGDSSSKVWDNKDPASTNVCILNLPSNITETTFGMYFAKYGDVASVKIMWPRTAEDLSAPNLRSTKTPGATGFINFMDRSDAERAFREVEGSQWLGCHLRTSWGKALRRQAVPLHRQSEALSIKIHKEAGQGDLTLSSRSPRMKSHRRLREDSPSPVATLEDLVTNTKGKEAVKKIQYVADQVKQYGKSFEDMLRNKEKDNPLLSFLQHTDTSENDYYQTLLDSRYVFVLPVPSYKEEGDASLYSTDTEEDSEWEKLRSKERTKDLGRAAGRRLQSMLRGITLRRERIARVMVFAIDHAAAAEIICNTIVESLLQSITPLSRKLARLYIVSDILHNSSVSASNAWRYRSLFEDKLDEVFMHWGDVANSFAGRIKRESCKEMARSVINAWEQWLVYESAKLNAWRQNIEEGCSGREMKVEDVHLGGGKDL